MLPKILCIDDYDERGLRCAVLIQAGYDAEPCLSSTAVHKLRTMSFDAVLMRSDLSDSTTKQIIAAVPSGTRVLRPGRGFAGQELVDVVRRLFAPDVQAAYG